MEYDIIIVVYSLKWKIGSTWESLLTCLPYNEEKWEKLKNAHIKRYSKHQQESCMP